MLENLKEKIYSAKGKKQSLIQRKKEYKDSLSFLEKEIERIKKAEIVILTVAKQTQEQLEFNLSEIVSLGMGIVFNNPYKLSLEFEPKKCFLKFKKGEKTFDPMFSAGGGVGNIAGNNLRCAILKVSQPKVRNFLFLDEPFSGLKGEDANKRALKMLQTICKELDMQIIMIADERLDKEIITKYADKSFEFYLEKDITKIKEI